MPKRVIALALAVAALGLPSAGRGTLQASAPAEMEPLQGAPFPLPTPSGRPDPRIPGGFCVVGETCGELHWNFEDRDHDGRGDLRGWDGEGAFLRSPSGALLQPTYGDNVTLRRQLALLPAAGDGPLQRIRPVADLGGDYWDVAWPIGQEGDFWIGTGEARPVARAPSGTRTGDSATGAMASVAFLLQRPFIKFLAGGTCGTAVHVRLEQRVTRRAVRRDCTALTAAAEAAAAAVRCPGPNCASTTQASARAEAARARCVADTSVTYEDVATPAWERVNVVTGYQTRPPHRPILARYEYTPTPPTCGERMTRISWSTEPITRQGNTATYRLRIVDGDPTGHVNADDFWVTDRAAVPEPAVPLWGLADLHTHPAAHRAYDGMLMAGTPAGATPGAAPRTPAQFWDDMAGCKSTAHPCHRLPSAGRSRDPLSGEPQCDSPISSIVLSKFTRGRLPEPPAPGSGGPPLDLGAREADGDFLAVSPTVDAAMPSWFDASHQMMHVNWLQRAHQGGLRLLVASAVNNRSASWLLAASPVTVPSTDDEAIERQFDYLRDLARANQDWMEIVLSPAHARRVIGQGKLALVLGTEVDSYAGCDNVASFVRESGANTPALTTTCTTATLTSTLDHFVDRGQRLITPIHLADNAFGGMAVYSDIFNASSNWLNRGDKGNLCADPRMPTSLCARPLLDAGNVYPPLMGCSCVRFGLFPVPCPVVPGPDSAVVCPDDLYVSFFGYPRLRDGTANLGSHGFELKPKQAYLTMTYAPLVAHVQSVASFTARQPGYGDRRPDQNALGLTGLGRGFIGAIMSRGLVLDVQHMSDLALNEVLGLEDRGLGAIPGGGTALTARGDAACGRLDVGEMSRDPRCAALMYPVLSSHGGVRDEARPLQNENLRDGQQLARIYQTGGLVGLGTIGGTSPFFESFERARATLAGAGVALGSDLNGGDAGAPSRLLRKTCFEASTPPSGRAVRYTGRSAPYTLHQCGGLASPPVVSFPLDDAPPLRPQVTDFVTFDINQHGYTNVGMYPDYLQDLRAAGMRADDRALLFHGAERFVQQWEKSCRLAQATSPEASDRSCRCDPGTAEGRPFCPRESPGLP